MALTPDPNTWQMLTCDPRWLHMAILAISTLQTLVNGLAGISLGWAWVCVLTVSDHSPKNLGDAPPPPRTDGLQGPQDGCAQIQGPPRPALLEASHSQKLSRVCFYTNDVTAPEGEVDPGKGDVDVPATPRSGS